ncbi:MAG: autotransporter domain-containing protein [Verrucomicrobia bacterium]|nr:autotransporter domain-containing protein [Verrucomicrobiota bacterium]
MNNGTTAVVGPSDTALTIANAFTLTIGETIPSSVVQLLAGGTLNVANSVLIEPNGTLTLSGGVFTAPSIQDNGILLFNTFSQNFSSNVSGTGSLVVDLPAADILTVSSPNNTYSGPTLVFAGTLRAASTGAFSPNSAFTVNSTLDLFGFNNTIGSLSGSGTVLNSGGATATLTVGNDNSSTLFSGVLEDGTAPPADGALALTKVGTGTLTLTGTNTYTGGTTINGGTLQLGNGGITGSIVGNVTDNATLAFDRSDVFTFAGLISGTGGIQQIGTGTTVLTANNTYSGGTTVMGGTLQLGNGGTTGSIVGTVTNNGILAFDRSDVVTFAGLISGTGSVQQIGTGTTVLTANDTYSGGTTISAGTLQLGNGGTTGSIIGNVTNNGILVFDRSDVFTLGGAITGAGSVQQIGTGTTVLTGNNTYTGGTTISAGTLQLGNGGTTGNITGNVINNGTLAFERSDVVTFAGIISGTGAVRQIGTGTTVLTANNTYTGGTTISAGTLQLGSGGTSGSISGSVVDNGILTFDRSDLVTFGGAISGTGAVIKLGGNTLMLAGANTYTGTTRVNAGVLQAGSAGAFSADSAFIVSAGSTLDLNGFNSRLASLSGAGTVSNTGAGAATLTVGDNTSSLFSGVMEDDGTLALTKVGTGTLTLTGTNTYTGTTTVDNGSLIVDGSIASAQTLVEAAGFLGGTGLIGGNLVNDGIVNPGNPVGTLTVSGDYTQTSSGTLRIQIAGLAPGQFGLLAVGGHASLAGTLQLVALNGFKLQVGNTITFLTAGGGVSGSFTTIQNPFISGTIVKAQVVQLADAVEITGAQGNFVDAACNPNSAAVARALNSAVGDPRAAALITFLNNQPIQDLCADFTLIAPEQLSSMYNMGVSLAGVQMQNLSRRMDSIHYGSSGFSAAGFTLNGNAPSLMDGLSGPTGAEGKAGPAPLAPVPENRWGFFVTGLGDFTHLDGTSGAAGFDLQTGGITLGADYRIGSNFAVGVMAGYAHLNADLIDNGDVEVNTGKVGAYATVFGNGFYLDTAVTGSFDGYDTHRAALLGFANGSTDGSEVTVLVAGGYDWKKGNLSIGPIANFQYTHISLSGFTESGSLAPLTYPDQSTDSWTTSIGIKSYYDWQVGHVLVRPEVSLAWQHEYGDNAYSIVAGFANGAGTNFTVTGPPIGRDSLLVGAGVAVIWSDRVTTYIYYDGDLARTNYQSNSITGGVRITF